MMMDSKRGTGRISRASQTRAMSKSNRGRVKTRSGMKRDKRGRNSKRRGPTTRTGGSKKRQRQQRHRLKRDMEITIMSRLKVHLLSLLSRPIQLGQSQIKSLSLNSRRNKSLLSKLHQRSSFLRPSLLTQQCLNSSLLFLVLKVPLQLYKIKELSTLNQVSSR